MNFLLGVGINLIAAIAIFMFFPYIWGQKSNITFEEFCPKTSYNGNVQKEFHTTALQEEIRMKGAAYNLSARKGKSLVAVTMLYRGSGLGSLTACKDEARTANAAVLSNQTFGIMKDGRVIWKDMLL